MATTAANTSPRRRTAPKEARRLQLIQATIRSVAKRGLSDTTIATVAREAKLSQGIINLHFKSKDRLLVETLRYLADDYKTAWEKALGKAGPTAAEKLAALVALDFERAVCDRNKLAVWFAFWGETKSRPTYRKICAERDREYADLLIELCRDITEEGQYQNVDPAAVANGLSAMSEGLWLDLLISPQETSREEARDTCMAYLASVFPKHFPNR